MKLYDLIFRCCFIGVSLFFVSQFCQNKTKQFTISAITSHRPYRPEYEISSLDTQEKQEVKKALDQPYFYCNKGGQAFIFSSRDGQYVIKFFKQRLYRRSPLLNLLPLPPFLYRYRDKRNWKRDNKLERDFFSYKAAFTELKEETGVLFVHLNQTDFLKQKLEIIDPLSIHHFLDLDHFDFLLQKRGETVPERISRLAQAADLPQLKKAIGDLLELIVLRSKKGFYDRDPEILTNCGFFQEKAIKLDVGRFVRYKKAPTKEEFAKEFLSISAPFSSWIQTYYPELFPFYQEQVKKVLEE